MVDYTHTVASMLRLRFQQLYLHFSYPTPHFAFCRFVCLCLSENIFVWVWNLHLCARRLPSPTTPTSNSALTSFFAIALALTSLNLLDTRNGGKQTLHFVGKFVSESAEKAFVFKRIPQMRECNISNRTTH